MKSYLALALLLIVSLGASFALQKRIDTQRPDLKFTGEMRYLPKGPAMDITSCGVKGVVADIFWIKALCYVTDHFDSRRHFPYLARIFEVVTDLDPHFVKAYHYAGFLLTSAAQETPAAIKLLTKGVKENPSHWRLQYDLAHIYGFYAKDKTASAKYFAMAATTATAQGKDASILFDQATDYYMQNGGYREARLMWHNFATSHDKKRQAIAAEQIKRIDAQEMIDQLQSAVNLYRQKKEINELDELVGFHTRKGRIAAIPPDPFGERYTLIDGRVSCPLFNRELYAKRLVFLRGRIAAFQKKLGYFPTSLEEIVIQKLATDIPPSPTGKAYNYDPISGAVE